MNCADYVFRVTLVLEELKRRPDMTWEGDLLKKTRLSFLIEDSYGLSCTSWPLNVQRNILTCPCLSAEHNKE